MESEGGFGNDVTLRGEPMIRPMDDSDPMQEETVAPAINLPREDPVDSPKEEVVRPVVEFNGVRVAETEGTLNDRGEENSIQLEQPETTKPSPKVAVAHDRKSPPKEMQEQQKVSSSSLPSSWSVLFRSAQMSGSTKTAIPATTVSDTTTTKLQDGSPTQQQEQQQQEIVIEGRNPPSPHSIPISNDKPIKSEIQCSNEKASRRKDLRRKNRRRLHRLLKNPGTLPSFLRVIEERKEIKKEPKIEEGSTPKDEKTNHGTTIVLQDDSDDDFLLEPPKVVIDVDEYLGLKKKRKFSEAILSASLVPSNTSILSTSNEIPPTPVSSVAATSTLSNSGWYEGSCPMAMIPDDAMYLTENQQFIRKNMEFFTATAIDLAATSNRRTPVEIGRVGFRCMHCAKAFREGRIPKMPPASVSFPKNFTALYNLTIQKQQMHIDSCPHVPSEMKWTKNEGGAKSRKRRITNVPALAYWQISCRRIGIVELKDNSGLRFERDPKQEPLPFDTIRRELEEEQPGLIPGNKHNGLAAGTGPVTVLSTNSVGFVGTAPTSTDPTVIALNDSSVNLPKDVMDVLEQARGEEQDLTHHLISKDDSSFLSDFMFLTIKQATFCHAITEDFSTRGKKTKLMRLGYAGFCCRHCKRNYSPNGTNEMNVRVFQNSCRSFSSSRDNLGSAMSNSFVLHLMKCACTPLSIKHALQSLKRVHSKQIHRLPYGSQSGVFLKIWQRIRAADKPIQKGDARVFSPARSHNAMKVEEDEEYRPDSIGSSMGLNHRVTSPNKARSSRLPLAHVRLSKEEFHQVLKETEENWDPGENDNLIQREDRQLISDFVFLLMRQLKVAIPTGTDFRFLRMVRMAGVCCAHCSGTRAVSSGRSFPSAPDNIAGILKATIYNHMMSCPRIPNRLKESIEIARKSHNQQCSSLPYGSQRRYFQKLFERLRNVPLEGVLATTTKENTMQAESAYLSALQRCAFVRTKNPTGGFYWQCSKCRMVPYDYRARGSIYFSKPPVEAMEQHRIVCQNDGVDWGTILSSCKALSAKYGGAIPLVERESFSSVIRSVVGSEAEVFDTYMAKLRKVKIPPGTSYRRDIWRKLPFHVDFDSVQESFLALRKDLDLPPANLRDCPDFLDFLRLVSVNLQIPPMKSLNGPGEGLPSNSMGMFLGQQASTKNFVPSSESKVTENGNSNMEAKSVDEEILSMERNAHNLKKESSVVNQQLTWDQGLNVMENIEAGQFDDA